MPVDSGDEFLLEQARDLAAGVVVRGIRDAELPGTVEQRVTRKTVSQRRMVMLALGN